MRLLHFAAAPAGAMLTLKRQVSQPLACDVRPRTDWICCPFLRAKAPVRIPEGAEGSQLAMSGDGWLTATPLVSMVADLPCAVCGKQSAHVELVAPG